MKRIISSILAVILVLGTCIVPFAAEVPKITAEVVLGATAADNYTKVTISGKTDANTNVTVEVLKPGKTVADTDAFEYIDQAKSDATGAYKVEFPTFGANVSVFTVRMRIGNAESIYTTTATYTPTATVIAAFDNLLAANNTVNDPAEFLAILQESKAALGLDSVLLNAMVALGIDVTAALRETFVDNTQVTQLAVFQNVFNENLALKAANSLVKKVNLPQTGADLLKLFSANDPMSAQTAFGLSAGVALPGLDAAKGAARYARYIIWPEATQLQVIQYFLDNKPVAGYADVNAVYASLNKGMYVAEMKNMVLWTFAGDIISNNTDLVGAALYASYTALPANARLTADQYIFTNKFVITDVASANALIAEAINKALTETPTPQPTSVPNNGGNGGGSGGGVVISIQTPTPAPLFDDLDSVEWAKEAINALAAKGVLNGKEAGKFVPNDNVTREEFAKIAVLAFGFADATAMVSFSDVPQDSWFYTYVASASKGEIITGKGDGTFGAFENITREDVAVICYRAGVLKNADFANAADAGLNFTDKDSISSYATKAVSVLTSVGVINGMGDGAFAPKATCTRAQAAKIIYGISKLIK